MNLWPYLRWPTSEGASQQGDLATGIKPGLGKVPAAGRQTRVKVSQDLARFARSVANFALALVCARVGSLRSRLPPANLLVPATGIKPRQDK